MNKINLFDNIFSHTTSSAGLVPRNFEYVRNNASFDGITIFTDSHILSNYVDRVNSKYKIGWLCESKAIFPYTLEFIKSVEHKYDYFFTHDKSLIDYNPNKFLYVIPASWREHFPDQHVNLYENKSKLVSFCFSNKTGAKGHSYRHEVSKQICNFVDCMGTGTDKPFSHFERYLAYKDYMFTIIIENENYDYYYSEKIIEPYWAGTIPIYWGGSHNLGLIRNVLGMDTDSLIMFKNTDELLSILKNLSKDFYYEKLNSVIYNHNLFKKPVFRLGSEEFFYENYLKNYFETGSLKNIQNVIS